MAAAFTASNRGAKSQNASQKRTPTILAVLSLSSLAKSRTGGLVTGDERALQNDKLPPQSRQRLPACGHLQPKQLHRDEQRKGKRGMPQIGEPANLSGHLTVS